VYIYIYIYIFISNFLIINSLTASGTHLRKSRIFAAEAGKFLSGVIDRSVHDIVNLRIWRFGSVRIMVHSCSSPT